MSEQALSTLCAADQSLLLVVDMQQRLLGAMDNAAATEQNCVILIQAADILSVPVIVTQQYPKGLGTTVEKLEQQLPEQTPVLDKTCFSCTGSEEFPAVIGRQNRKQIILCGIEAHVCVLQTALELFKQGYQVFVAGDGVSSRARQNKENALQRLQSAGIIISNTESVLFEWLRDARHPQFKAVSALIR